ncbi:MAG: hypothetical protein HXM13_05120 [Fusobacterium periodonticum]|nr:hypothetical protein [Fusobacterium periodonticum]
MLTTTSFIEKYNNNTLTSEEIKNIPFDFTTQGDEEIKWLPVENNEKEFIFYLKENNKIYSKDKIKMKVKEIDYKF